VCADDNFLFAINDVNDSERNFKMTVFWEVASCSRVEIDDGGSKHL
jgi:hypothetical protein